MEPWLDDLADDLQSLSFTSTATTATTTTDVNRSTSCSSEATLTVASSSAHGSFSSCTAKPGHRLRPHLALSDLRFLHRLGSGDIGSVYLAELKCGPTSVSAGDGSGDGCPVFAAKVMDKRELASRSKEGRARTEMEILETLEHPFLPSLYASVDSPKWLCLLTEFCPGGDLHVLRQRQPLKRFEESAVRCVTFSLPPLFLSVNNCFSLASSSKLSSHFRTRSLRETFSDITRREQRIVA